MDEGKCVMLRYGPRCQIFKQQFIHFGLYWNPEFRQGRPLKLHLQCAAHSVLELQMHSPLQDAIHIHHFNTWGDEYHDSVYVHKTPLINGTLGGDTDQSYSLGWSDNLVNHISVEMSDSGVEMSFGTLPHNQGAWGRWNFS